MLHIIESQQFNRDSLENLFESADRLENTNSQPLKGKIMASLFYEPSTRTRFSFESAMIRLGGSVITTENAQQFSSVSKGETLEDTIRVIGSYVDVIVLRHFLKGASEQAVTVASVPIINAGDGVGQHPTQALLDLYTIKKELGTIDNISIALVGDLKNGRTIRSLAYLLGKYTNIKIYFISPKELAVADDILEYLTRHEVNFECLENLEEIVGSIDVLYQTRIQKERFSDQEQYQKLKGFYQIDPELVSKMKDKSIIMHPLPRVDEISTEVDNLKQAVYFKQAKYGLLVRMALLEKVLS